MSVSPSFDLTLHWPSKCLVWVACLWSKMPMFWRAEMREGGLPLPPTFQHLNLKTWRACDLNFIMISSLTSKRQNFKLRGLQFHFIKQLKNRHPCNDTKLEKVKRSLVKMVLQKTMINQKLFQSIVLCRSQFFWIVLQRKFHLGFGIWSTYCRRKYISPQLFFYDNLKLLLWPNFPLITRTY